MDGMKNYLISVCCAAVLCGILKQIVGSSKMSSGMIRVLSGLFIAICIVSPWKNFRVDDLKQYNPLITEQGDLYAMTGYEITQKKIDKFIIQNTEAYILEKANQLQTQVEVSVSLSEDSIPVSVQITGQLSQEAKEELSAFLLNNIGIQKEMQIWR